MLKMNEVQGSREDVLLESIREKDDLMKKIREQYTITNRHFHLWLGSEEGDQLGHVDEQTVRSFQVGNFRRQSFDHDRTTGAAKVPEVLRTLEAGVGARSGSGPDGISNL